MWRWLDLVASKATIPMTKKYYFSDGNYKNWDIYDLDLHCVWALISFIQIGWGSDVPTDNSGEEIFDEIRLFRHMGKRNALQYMVELCRCDYYDMNRAGRWRWWYIEVIKHICALPAHHFGWNAALREYETGKRHSLESGSFQEPTNIMSNHVSLKRSSRRHGDQPRVHSKR